MPHRPDLTTLAGAELSDRHREVLREAMRLFAERGYVGTSLRELARRVGMQQPSLYHYFRSKEELVEQILATYGFGGIGNTPPDALIPDRIEDLPAALAAVVTMLYDHTDWPIFVRFVFNLSLEQQRWAPRLRAMFVETTSSLFQQIMVIYEASGQIDAKEGEYLARMVVNAIGLLYIEERLLFPAAKAHPTMDEYKAFVVRFVTEAVRARVGLTKVGAAKAQELATPSPPLPPRPRADRRTPARGRQRGS